jgi:hypothetical protein
MNSELKAVDLLDDEIQKTLKGFKLLEVSEVKRS